MEINATTSSLQHWWVEKGRKEMSLLDDCPVMMKLRVVLKKSLGGWLLKWLTVRVHGHGDVHLWSPSNVKGLVCLRSFTVVTNTQQEESAWEFPYKFLRYNIREELLMQRRKKKTESKQNGTKKRSCKTEREVGWMKDERYRKWQECFVRGWRFPLFERCGCR